MMHNINILKVRSKKENGVAEEFNPQIKTVGVLIPHTFNKTKLCLDIRSFPYQSDVRLFTILLFII